MVGGTVTNLMKVSVLIRDGTCRDRYEYALRAAARGNNTAVTGWDVDHVMAKYPKLERRRGLAQRLGKANTDRRHFLTYLRDHRDRLAGEELESPETCRFRLEQQRLPQPGSTCRHWTPSTILKVTM
jgi:hypothetical protein